MAMRRDIIPRSERRQLIFDCLAALSAIAAAFLVLRMFTGFFPTKANPYNSYTRQALAWLSGRLDLPEDVPHLELAIYEGKYYVSFPPFPSYVMLPFAAIFGMNTPDGFIAMGVTALGVIYAIRLCRSMNCGDSSVFWVLFAYLSNGFLFIGLNGYVWFIAQNMAITLSFMSLYYALSGKGGSSLTSWACSVGCRPMLAVFLPFLIYLLWQKEISKPENAEKNWLQIVFSKLFWAIGPCILAASYMILNYMRFGNVLEFGHSFLPEFQRAENGQFSLSYVPENFHNLLRFPQWKGDSLPVEFPDTNGFCFLMALPIFIPGIFCIVYGLIKRKGSLFHRIFLPCAIAGYIFILLCHRTMGGWHFGNRYLLDTVPYLLVMILALKPNNKAFDTCCLIPAVFGMLLNVARSVLVYT